MKEGDEEEASIFRRSLQQRNTKRAISVQRGVRDSMDTNGPKT
jgi:hypothetical protein